MHHAAHEWVRRFASDGHITVLDIGGRSINGTVRDLFPHATYTCVDMYDGPGVDIVADATNWDCPDNSYDIVVSVEVFEHCENWHALCALAYRVTTQLFVCTMAGPGRGEHSGIDGNELREGEYYGNVDPNTLYDVLKACGFSQVTVDQSGEDVRAMAVK